MKKIYCLMLIRKMVLPIHIGKDHYQKILQEIYIRILPIHPKGDDSTGKYFSLKGLEKARGT